MPAQKVNKADYTALKALHDATNVAVADLEKDNTVLRARIIFLEQQLTNADSNVSINKKIMIDTVTTANLEKAAFAQEIALLKAEIAELKKD